MLVFCCPHTFHSNNNDASPHHCNNCASNQSSLPTLKVYVIFMLVICCPHISHFTSITARHHPITTIIARPITALFPHSRSVSLLRVIFCLHIPFCSNKLLMLWHHVVIMNDLVNQDLSEDREDEPVTTIVIPTADARTVLSAAAMLLPPLLSRMSSTQRF